MTASEEDERIRKRPDDEDADIYDEDGNVRSDFLTLVGAAIADRDTIFLRQNVARLHESEIGDLLEAIQPEQRLALVRLLGDDFDMTALTEVDEAIRREIVDQMPNEQIAAAIGDATTPATGGVKTAVAERADDAAGLGAAAAAGCSSAAGVFTNTACTPVK